MDQEQQQPSPAGRRKSKFIPKPPLRRKPRTEAIDAKNNEDEAADARKLITKFNENLRRKVPKLEKKSDVQVVFGTSSTESTTLKKYGVPVREKNVASRKTEIIESTNYNDDETAKEDGSIKYITDEIAALPTKIKKDYREPWDYNHTYYPTTLPLRRPYSGDPELLNEAEFGVAASQSEYDEKSINPALDLGLLEESDKLQFLLFKFPPKLPTVKSRSASAKGKEKVKGSIPLHGKGKGSSSPKEETCLEELPEGFMGRIFVYQSGAVKLKLGDTLFEVSCGSDSVFAQDVMAMNTAAKECITMGELQKRAVITPDIDGFIDSIMNSS